MDQIVEPIRCGAGVSSSDVMMQKPIMRGADEASLAEPAQPIDLVLVRRDLAPSAGPDAPGEAPASPGCRCAPVRHPLPPRPAADHTSQRGQRNREAEHGEAPQTQRRQAAQRSVGEMKLVVCVVLLASAFGEPCSMISAAWLLL